MYDLLDCQSLSHFECVKAMNSYNAGFRIDAPSPGPSKFGRMAGWLRVMKNNEKWQDLFACLTSDAELCFYRKEDNTVEPVFRIRLADTHWNFDYRPEKKLDHCSNGDMNYVFSIRPVG